MRRLFIVAAYLTLGTNASGQLHSVPCGDPFTRDYPINWEPDQSRAAKLVILHVTTSIDLAKKTLCQTYSTTGQLPVETTPHSVCYNGLTGTESTADLLTLWDNNGQKVFMSLTSAPLIRKAYDSYHESCWWVGKPRVVVSNDLR